MKSDPAVRFTDRSMLIPIERISFVIAVNVYYVVLFAAYHRLVVPSYSFWGLGDSPIGWPYLVVSWMLSVLPALWTPISLKRPSLLLFLIVYLVVFIPSTFIVYYSANPVLPPNDALLLVVVLFLGLVLLSSVYAFPVLPLKRIKMPSWLIWNVIGILVVASVGYLLIEHGVNLRLVSFEEIYELRQEMAEKVVLTGTALGFYAIMWLANFLLPLLFAQGVCNGRWSLWFLALLGEFFLYLVGGFKMTVLALIYLPLTFFLLRRFTRVVSLALTVGITLLLLPGFLPNATVASGTMQWFVGVVHFRAFSVPGLLLAQYYDFFRHHPLTHFSHVTGVNRLIAYPYEVDIPRTLGFYYYGAPDLGSNATFWAADGLAGFGLAGILVISVICGVVFWLFDACASRHDPVFSALAATVIAVSLANISLFTTLWSGGFILLMTALWLLPGKTDSGVGREKLPGLS